MLDAHKKNKQSKTYLLNKQVVLEKATSFHDPDNGCL